jgi:16S rRNA (uracil1498-N3)-methyltransferase
MDLDCDSARIATPKSSSLHSQMHRCYAPPPWTAEQISLADSEANHVQRVLRLHVGDEIELFDGEGIEAPATITAASKRGVEVSIGPRRDVPEPARRLTLLCPAPKGDRIDWLVEKATELGVACWQPIITDRSVVTPRESRLDRLRSLVIAACKQSRRSRLMKIGELRSLSDAVRMSSTPLWLADPGGDAWPESRLDSPPTELRIAIGPEGGFTSEEIAAALSAGALCKRFSTPILRMETAAIAAAAWWLL